MSSKPKGVAILDFGSQYTQLIARRIREQEVYSEIVSCSISAKELRAKDPSGVILSGGPSAPGSGAPPFDQAVLELGIPVLGVCYGMQLLNCLHGGSVVSLQRGEYGRQTMRVEQDSPILGEFDDELQVVWMSHGCSVERLASVFRPVASSCDGLISAIAHESKPIYGVQFHPEVSHTAKGREILANFLRLCRCSTSWKMIDVVEGSVEAIRKQVGDGRIVSLVSGGVDSTAATLLCLRAVGPDRVIPIHIDTGLMRERESERVVDLLRRNGLAQLRLLEVERLFLRALNGVAEPEEKRRIIGDLFVSTLDRELESLGIADEKTYICQGTLYTDLIESGRGCGGQAAVIKSHHNVNSPLVQQKRDRGLVVEPNASIFKDEVRKVSELLGVPHELAWRHPFPGPGLAIRILGEVTREKVVLLRQADSIFLDEIRRADLYDQIWQAFAVLVPATTVGVMGDCRTEGQTVALRAVTSSDGMTADVFPFPYETLTRISSRIVNEVKGVNRVVYDVTSKPPATIEWE